MENVLTGESTTYTYNTDGELISVTQGDENDQIAASYGYTYNENKAIEKVEYDLNYTTSAGQNSLHMYYTYGYDSTDKLTRYNVYGTDGASGYLSYAYDTLGRVTQKSTNLSNFNSTTSHTYKDLNATYTTTMPSSTTVVTEGESKTYTYTYDSKGNITRISDGTYATSYAYDSLNQLTRENNQALGKTYVYTYDDAGNRTSKKTYAYTTGTLGTATATQTLTYSDGAWGDQRTGTTYDAVGNPLTYGIYTMTWSGRQLMRMTAYGGMFEYSFTYNDEGIRTSKTSGGTVYTYTLEGSTIISQQWGIHLLVFLYDESGSPIGLQYRKNSYTEGDFDTFYFEKNVFGDIIGVYTEAGTYIGGYTYDAWGNCTVSVASGNTALQSAIVRTMNPFRYRGYYYDTETSLYYLQSRYYDPSTGRFVNADGYISTGTGLLGYNMYAYCNNNPVMNVDPKGKWTISVGVSGYAVFIGGISYSYNLVLDGEGNIALQVTEANILKNQSGAMFGLAGAGVSQNVGWSNAPTVYDLEGISYTADVSIGQLGVEVSLPDTPNIGNSMTSASISKGASVQVVPGDPHVTASRTSPIFTFNIGEAIENIFWGVVSWFS